MSLAGFGLLDAGVARCSCPCPSCPEQPHLVQAPGPVESVPKAYEMDWPVDGEGQEIRMKALVLLVSKS